MRCCSVILILCLLFAVTPPRHLLASSDDIELYQQQIADAQAAKAAQQAELKTLETRYKATLDVYTKGYDKFKKLHDEATNYQKKVLEYESDLFILRATYGDFYSAYTSYQDSWRAYDYDQMVVEYKKMFRYMNGTVKPLPNVTADDVDTRFNEVRGWFLKIGGRWTIRMLHATVSVINKINVFKSSVNGVKSAMESTNEGLKAAIQYWTDQGIETIKEEALTTLKETGQDASSTFDKAVTVIEGVASPLGMFESELKKMVSRIDKEENLGFQNKETAITKTTEAKEQMGALYQATYDDAQKVLTTIKPILDYLNDLKADIAAHNAAIRTLDQQIAQLSKNIAKETTTIKTEAHLEAIIETYGDVSGCSTSSISAGISGNPVYKDGNVMLAVDALTQVLTGYPGYLDLTVSSGCQGLISATAQCNDDEGNTTILNYKTAKSLASSGVDSAALSLFGPGLTYDNTATQIIASAALEEPDSFYFFLDDGFAGYSTETSECSGQTITRYTGINTGLVSSNAFNYQTVEVESVFLIPYRFINAALEPEAHYPTHANVFGSEDDKPDLDYRIAYRLKNEENFSFITPDHLDVTYSEITPHPDGIKTGQVILEASMDTPDGQQISLASLELYMSDLKPTVSYTDYFGKETTISNSGGIPYNVPLSFELERVSSFSCDDETLKVEWNFNGQKVESGFAQGVTITDPSLIGQSFYVSYNVFYKDTNDNKISLVNGNYGTLTVLAQADRIKTKLESSEIGVTGVQNRFVWEGYTKQTYARLYGETEGNEFPLIHLGEDSVETLFEYRYFAGGINKVMEADISGQYVYFRGDEDLEKTGGYIGLYQRQIVTDDDVQTIYEDGLIDVSPMRYDGGLILGVNFNILKLRISESNDFSRTIHLLVNGPANMSDYTVRWTFEDSTTTTSSFSLVNGLYESSIPHSARLNKIELLAASNLVVEEIAYATYWSRNPSSSYENRSLYEQNNHLAATTFAAPLASGVYQPYTQQIFKGGASDDLVSRAMSFTPVSNFPQVTSINNWEPTPIENLELTSEGTLRFQIGHHILRTYTLIAQPDAGSVSLDHNTVSYDPEGTTSGIVQFSFQLGSDYIDSSSTYYDGNSIDSRILSVSIDLSATPPTVSFTEDAIGGEISRDSTYDYDTRVQFDSEVTITTQTSDVSLTLLTTETDNDTLSYKNYENDYTHDDSGVINSDTSVDIRSHRKKWAPTTEKRLAAGEQIFISKAFLLSRFEEETLDPIVSIGIAYLPTYYYVPATGEHGDVVTLSHDGEVLVPTENGNYHSDFLVSIDDFHGLEGVASKSYSNLDSSPSMFELYGITGDGTKKYVYIFFFTEGVDPDKPIFFIEKEYSRTADTEFSLSYLTNRNGTGYYLITTSTFTTNAEVKAVLTDSTMHDYGMNSGGYYGVRAEEEELNRSIPTSGTYSLYFFVEDDEGNQTEFYKEKLCAQITTEAYNPSNGTTGTFSTPCDVPDGWIVGTPPDDDEDDMNDIWEIYFFGNTTTTDGSADQDGDGYSDLQEYINSQNGELDPDGEPYLPVVANAPNGTGYVPTGAVPGDIDGNGDITLRDAILGLQLLTGSDATRASDSGNGGTFADSDVDGDALIGLAEVIFDLNQLSLE